MCLKKVKEKKRKSMGDVGGIASRVMKHKVWEDKTTGGVKAVNACVREYGRYKFAIRTRSAVVGR